MSDLTKLIEDVRAATGADRKLDLEIIAVLLAPPDAFVKQSPFNGKWCIYLGGPHNDRGSQRLWRPEGWDWADNKITGSTDAALALVERKLPGWSFELGKENHHENGFYAKLWCSWGPKAYQRIEAVCRPTLALAIVLALLLALSATEPK